MSCLVEENLLLLSVQESIVPQYSSKYGSVLYLPDI